MEGVGNEEGTWGGGRLLQLTPSCCLRRGIRDTSQNPYLVSLIYVRFTAEWCAAVTRNPKRLGRKSLHQTLHSSHQDDSALRRTPMSPLLAVLLTGWQGRWAVSINHSCDKCLEKATSKLPTTATSWTYYFT